MALANKNFISQRRVLAAGLAVLILLSAFYIYQTLNLLSGVKQLRSFPPKFEQALSNRDWPTAKLLIDEALANLERSQKSLYRLYPFTKLPFIKNEVDSVSNLLSAAEIILKPSVQVIDWAGGIPVLQSSDVNSFNDFGDVEKQQLLNAVAQAEPLWLDLKQSMLLSLDILNQSANQSNIPVLSKQIEKIRGQIENALTLYVQIEPWLVHLPDILGAPSQKTYLLLLQNNDELRPTGGFIGTFGVLQIKNGSIAGFGTENVYNLDEPAKKFNNKIPPLPIQRWLKQKQWFLRDVNWDPDFAATAETAIQFYKDERGPVENFDGVIGFTPRLIESFLRATGPIEVDGNVFDAENIVDKLQFQVDVGFTREGINEYNRKQIIDDLAQVLKDRLFNLSLTELKQLAPLLFSLLEEKHLMLYFVDANQQKLVTGNNWGNTILPANSDYIYVVDANLGSLKTDPAVEHAIHYELNANKNSYIAKLSITYNNTGEFDWKTTRYRTYARVYLPLGAKLIESDGNETTVDVRAEHNKTVFGAFISIEPGDQETLVLKYELPSQLTDRINKKDYSLLIQKQAGTSAHEFSYDISLPFGKNKFTGKLALDTDKKLSPDSY